MSKMFPQHSSHWCTTRKFHYLTLRVWACPLWANTLCSCSWQWMLKAPTKWQDWLVWALKSTLQGREPAPRPWWSSFVHLKTRRHLCPWIPSSKAASLLLATSPMQNADWTWSPFCSQHCHQCPSLNTLVILSNNFFEVRGGVRLLIALKHFLNEA